MRESIFTKLKLIKTYIRSTIPQEKLNKLVMVARKSDITKTIYVEMILLGWEYH